MDDLPLQARKQLAGFPKDKKKYEALLTDLLVQALVKLKQPAVIVKGREVSLNLPPGNLSTRDAASPAH